MKVAFFKADCPECGANFDVPSLGDMAYGSFLCGAENGKVFAIADCFHPAAKLIQCLQPEGTSSDVFRRTLVGLADPVLGQRMLFPNVCGLCGSKHINIYENESCGSGEVQILEYQGLFNLHRNEIISAIASYV